MDATTKTRETFPPGELAVLISGCAPAAGGLFILDASGVSMIDPLSTHGMAIRDGRLYRVMGCQDRAAPSSDLLVYDKAGVCRFDRLDGVGDPHDVLPRSGHVLVASPMENAVYAICDNGAKSTYWQASALKDAWHLNCLVEVEGELYASAFGMFDQSRGWSRELKAPTGVLIRLPSNEIALDGLSQPHSPRRIGDGWLICNSALNELAAYDERGRLLNRRQLGGYTRGLAFDSRHVYVGESSTRHINPEFAGRSRITILDRSDWAIVDSYEVAAAEIYEVLLVPNELVDGIRTGFRTNVSRVEQTDQFAMFNSVGVTPRRLWAIGEPLPSTSLRARFEGQVPAEMVSGQVIALPCRVTNTGDAIFISAPPNPIQLCYRWFDENGAPVGAGQWIHTNLPRALPPGETAEVVVRIAAPNASSTYTLAVTLLQEGVAWFDDLSSASGMRGTVLVTGR